ncbi:hypothetical protein NKR19_g433 [Coniochaeta hoffmannii]|uniref:Uncharacterized protein n=1 Tax=Coniochaeta hoffmannii TaxID=91930 RepID=A0AA38W497_9PEZI|nr:hypothetical protein NKR19_g433 [Coniochaeta hoffmannii]
MKNSALLTILASAAVASAQVTVDNGTYTCSKPNVAFCAGDSMKTDIIIRCDSTGQGQPGRCSDNLAGEPPVGVQPALCYQSDATTGDAACEKNCVVYGGSGNGNGTFTLPADQCTPTFTATDTGSGSSTATSTASSSESTSSETTSTETVTECISVCPTDTASTTPAGPTTGPVYPTGNGTITTSPTLTKPTTLTTGVPVKPTTTGPSSVPTAGAAANAAGGLLAGFGLALAYIL